MKNSITNTNYDLIVVPGLKLGPRWGIPNDLISRLKVAVEAYEKNPGVHIAVCGKWSIWFDWLGIKPPVTEAQKMKSYLLKHGVNGKDILMESRSKDTIGNTYYLKRIVRQNPQYKRLLVICASQHKKRIAFLFDTFFGPNYRINYLAVSAPHFHKNTTANETTCLKEQRELLKNVRPGHEEDFEHKLYNSPYYARQAVKIRLKLLTSKNAYPRLVS